VFKVLFGDISNGRLMRLPYPGVSLSFFLNPSSVIPSISMSLRAGKGGIGVVSGTEASQVDFS
jgi:hypothetical protein